MTSRNRPNASRRQFLAAAAGAGASALLCPERLPAADADPRVARIVASTLSVDMHSHVRPRYVKSPADARPNPMIDLATQIKRSGFSALCQTYDVDTTGKQDVGVYPEFNRIALHFEDRLLRLNHMRRALTLKDLQSAHAQRQPIIILARETDTADTRRRAIGKDLAREVAAAGGVVGVWWRGSDTLTDYVATIRAMVDTLDTEHVGIGTDSDITSSNILPYTNQIWADQSAGFFHAVADAMLRQGFTPVEVGKFGGGNFCRVFGKVTAGHA